ncbi:30S ribosomal protein S6 [Gammaproteobacteria bacterium]|jgi:small subunit ribosomal protein S6|nr:30S ribosomal protein S6 [SAR86 cluster bacterium]MDA8709407.1 30S ribosomal protein S6 [Gammaproteobacteria bacterium]MDA8799279.1 30S ribosomal protein S6 [Gammaproteobacteria bacterium]MDA9936030.1 30S ribosomal protein S6 [Gammaproteobacteria bacterium]MDC0332496.1 30S ribosomal protein S6 [Gammaproteobacteria bacterium]|tara:strand:+ start:59 stop:499 length:441 start_codon:yes stop_codon:yes gene_type:complete
MNNYELTLILNPDLSTKFDDFQTKFEKTLADINFTINKLENIGRRQLAYSILNHNKGHYAIFQIEGPSESALELESKLKYDTSVIRHLLLKVDSPSLEDSLLLIESREAKKAPQEEEQSQEKPKVTLAEQNQAAETVAKDESKDGE